jgi:hypothetical protein
MLQAAGGGGERAVLACIGHPTAVWAGTGVRELLLTCSCPAWLNFGLSTLHYTPHLHCSRHRHRDERSRVRAAARPARPDAAAGPAAGHPGPQHRGGRAQVRPSALAPARGRPAAPRGRLRVRPVRARRRRAAARRARGLSVHPAGGLRGGEWRHTLLATGCGLWRRLACCVACFTKESSLAAPSRAPLLYIVACTPCCRCIPRPSPPVPHRPSLAASIRRSPPPPRARRFVPSSLAITLASSRCSRAAARRAPAPSS